MSNYKDQAPTSFTPNMSSKEERLQATKRERLQVLRKEAYYNVLHAFMAEESPDISDAKMMILKDLVTEWEISKETHTALMDNLEDEPLIIHWEMKAHDKKQKLSATEEEPTSEDSSVPSWGDIDPETLVDKWIGIKLPDEEEYIPFYIGRYNAENEMHHLVASFSQTGYEDPCDWIDIRSFCAEEVDWQGESPGFPLPKRVLKPGKTQLRETSTARNKKQLKEYGKSASGIPILKNPDEGKEEKASPRQISIPAPGSSWGSGDAESLIGKHLRIKMPGESEKEDVVIKAYDAENGVHHIDSENTDPNAMETDERLNWIDLREIRPEDIEWKDEDKPMVDAPTA